MKPEEMQNLTLFDLIARSWDLETEVSMGCFNDDETVVGFSSPGGRVTLIPLGDEEPPHSRVRISGDLGKATISPRDKAIPTPIIVDGLGDTSPLIGAMPDANFVAGLSDGRLILIAPDGSFSELGHKLGGAVTSLRTDGASGKVICSDGDRVLLFDTENEGQNIEGIEPQSVNSLGFSPTGKLFGIGGNSGLTVYSFENGDAVKTISFDGVPTSAVFSPDEAWVSCPLKTSGCALIRLDDETVTILSDYPAKVETAAWSKSQNAFATSGAFRVAAWSMDSPPIDGDTSGALETGRPGLVAVTTVATNPVSDFIAVGYENGQVMLAKIGQRDELILHTASSKICSLFWTKDGKQLAFASTDGLCAVVHFPPQMFK